MDTQLFIFSERPTISLMYRDQSLDFLPKLDPSDVQKRIRVVEERLRTEYDQDTECARSKV